jgi:hypothetical protein
LNDGRTKHSPRRSNLTYGNYRSLRQMYLALKPDMTYLAFYKRVKAGMKPEDAAAAPKSTRGRKRRRPLPWENASETQA